MKILPNTEELFSQASIYIGPLSPTRVITWCHRYVDVLADQLTLSTMRKTLIIAAQVLTLFVWNTGFAEFPLIHITVRQESGRVDFDFYEELDMQRSDHAIAILTLYTIPERLVWQIAAAESSMSAKHVTYGVLPVGFIQETPDGRPAPMLEDGVEYHVAVRGGGTGHASFIYAKK
jgi:hypothetical protein